MKFKHISVFSVAILFMVMLSYCSGHRNGKRMCEQKYKLPKGSVVVPQSFLDSLNAVANQKPDTIRITKWVKGDPVETDEPVADFNSTVIDPDIPITQYERRLINVGIDAWVQLRVNGHLENFKWGYSPLYLRDYTQVTIPHPVPVIREKIVKVPQRGLYGGINAGGMLTDPGFGPELFFLQRNGLYYGGQVMSFDNNRYIMGKVGFKIL